MRFYKLDQVTVSRDDQVFKASPTFQTIGLLMTSGVVLTLLVLAVRGGTHHRHGPPAFFYCVFAGMFGLFALYTYGSLRASRKPTNWLLRCQGRGLLIHYRSFRNWRFPADTAQVVGWDYSEIAWARVAKERRITPSMTHGGNSSETHFMTFVELGLVNPDTTEMEKYLSADRSISSGGGMVVLDYPVQVLPGGIMQMSWGGMHPSAHHAVEYLGRYVKTAETDHRVVDLVHHSKTPPEEERQKILQLVRSGDVLSAVTMAQRVYGYSQSEAHEFVEKLKSEA